MDAKLSNALARAVHEVTHNHFEVRSAKPLGGGCINQAWRLEGRDSSRYFVKFNDARRLNMFEAESAGLSAIAATRTVRVPQPIAHGTAGQHAYLVLEYLDLNGSGNARLLGKQLAALHRYTPPPCTGIPSDLPAPPPPPCRGRAGEGVDALHPSISVQTRKNEQTRFGFPHNNHIGTTPQPNTWSSDWTTFWREQRLGFQLELAERNGYGGKLQDLGQQLMERLPEFFAGYTPQPSLLHGDLWGGNHAYTADGAPVIFDPAPYYGDREADLAMTELFGGFDAGFYAAYRATWPLDAGYAARKDLYNLYHILNHANLFGGGYARQAEGMMQRLMAELG